MGLEEEMNLESRFVMPTFGRSKVEFVRGEGMRLYDNGGKEYLDFLSGIGVCSLGHCHPKVVEAVAGQAGELIHVSNYFYIKHRGEVAKKLSELLNRTSSKTSAGAASEANLAAHDWKTFFANSGAEANECAIKVARKWAKSKAEANGTDPDCAPSAIITLVKSFHGRTLATIAATGQAQFRKGFEPIPAGFVSCPINDLDTLKSTFEQMAGTVCAVMLECIQGESGVHVCTREFLEGVRRLCDDNGALMICDEVQCGVFRTGEPFAYQNFDIVPDIVTTAKGIASGVPAAACSARAEIADVMTPGTHGSTFGGSNLAMAAAYATLSELDSQAACTRIKEVGDYMRERLAQLPQVDDVRGMGLMIGIDIHGFDDAHQVVDAALELGLVINATGPNTLRFLPPLICEKQDVDTFIDKLTRAFDAVG